MTTTDTKLVDEIHDVSDEIAHQILDVVFHLSIAAALIKDEATQYDYCVAVDGLLTALGAPGDVGPEFAMGDRPEGNDDRPLYQRLGADSLVEQTVQVGVNKLGVVAVAYAVAAGTKLGTEEGYASYERLYHAIDDFGTALGLPHEGDDDEQHPNVYPNPLNDLIRSVNDASAQAANV